MLKRVQHHGCPWDSSTTKYARKRGHNEVYEWAVANGCPTNYIFNEDDDSKDKDVDNNSKVDNDSDGSNDF